MFVDFNKEGRGISKDEPEKTGIKLFLDILYREFWTLINLNLLFILCCLPIVTIGASYVALNSIIIKILRDKPVDLVHDFKTAFKENFVQGTIGSVITFIIVIVMITAFNFYFVVNPPLSYVILGLSFILLMINNYVFPLIASVDLKTKYVYRNSMNLMIICFPYSFFAGLLGTILFIICALFFPVTGLYLLILGFSFSCFLNSFLTYKGIKTYAEESLENQLLTQ